MSPLPEAEASSVSVAYASISPLPLTLQLRSFTMNPYALMSPLPDTLYSPFSAFPFRFKSPAPATPALIFPHIRSLASMSPAPLTLISHAFAIRTGLFIYTSAAPDTSTFRFSPERLFCKKKSIEPDIFAFSKVCELLLIINFVGYNSCFSLFVRTYRHPSET